MDCAYNGRMRFAALVCALCVLPASVSAQRLVEGAAETPPVHIDQPRGLEDGDALVVWGRDIGGRPVGLHVDAQSVRIEPPPTASRPAAQIAAVTACAGRRWLLEYDDAHVRFAVRPSGGVEIWNRAFSRDRFPSLHLSCSGNQSIVGWLDRGELVIVSVAAAAGAPSVARRTRIQPANELGDVAWTARTPSEIYALVRRWGQGEHTRLLRIARGAITHTRDLGASEPGTISIVGDRVLVGVSPARTDARTVTLQGFALADLARGPAVSVPATHEARCAALWSHPTDGWAVVAIAEGWSGPETAAGPSRGDRPPRYEPVRHGAVGLHVWAVGEGRIGPRFELGTREVGAGAVLGDGRLVLVQGVEADGVVRGEVQLRGARVRRFAVEQ